MKISDHIIRFLEEIGVSHVFVLPGGFSMHLNDSLNYSKITPVYCLHEVGAGFAACGYANYSGKLGVCLVTSAPGSTNILTAVASAWQDSLPILVISGDAKVANIDMRRRYRLRQGGAQDVEIEEMAKPITKYFFQPYTTDYIEDALEDMYIECMRPRRGPCWLSVPLDIQEMKI